MNSKIIKIEKLKHRILDYKVLVLLTVNINIDKRSYNS